MARLKRSPVSRFPSSNPFFSTDMNFQTEIRFLQGMTLNALLSMPQATQLGITKEKVEGMLAEVNKHVK